MSAPTTLSQTTPRAPSLTADVNALAWGQFHLRGGWRRLWGFIAFFVVAVGALVGLAVMSGGVTTGPLKFALLGVQAAILVLFVCSRVSAAVRQDLTTRMIESHRLMPMSPGQAVFGYLVGPAAHPLALAAANLVLGLFVSSMGGLGASLWLTANAVLLEFAAFLAVAVAFGAFSGKGSSAVVWLGFFIGVYSHAIIGFLLPALNVLATPLAGRTVFNLGAAGGEAAELYAPAAVFHVAFGAVFFLGCCRRYRRDDRLALGVDLGLALLVAWVAASAFAIVRWDDYRPSMMEGVETHPQVQFLGSLGAAMLLGIVPLNGAAFAAGDWAARRTLNDPSLGERPAPPLLVALVVAGLALTLSAVPLFTTGTWAGDRAATWAIARDVVARTAAVLAAYAVATLYVLRLLYRRTGSPQFALTALWLMLTWLVPMGIDFARWYSTDQRGDVLQDAAAFSPLGSLVLAWTGRADQTTAGIAFQVVLAAALAAAFHATARRPGTAPAPPVATKAA